MTQTQRGWNRKIPSSNTIGLLVQVVNTGKQLKKSQAHVKAIYIPPATSELTGVCVCG